MLKKILNSIDSPKVMVFEKNRRPFRFSRYKGTFLILLEVFQKLCPPLNTMINGRVIQTLKK